MSLWKAALLGGSAIFAINADALAQNPPRPPAEQTPIYDPRQFPVQHGQVQQFTLTPRSEIDGLILTDGTEVKTPPHLSTEMAYSVKPGDMVTIHGLRAAALPLVQAVSVADDQTGRTVIDNGPPDRGRRRPAPAPGLEVLSAGQAVPIPGLSEVRGHVRMSLHGPRGEVNGALLDDGTVLRLPPPEANRFAALLQGGQAVVAEGTVVATAIGRVFDVRQIGASREQLSLVETAPGREHRRP